MTAPAPPPRAYSYVRFSTVEQRKGTSLERQTAAARKYAEEHGLELDTELDLQDLGVSGFRLKNAETGALGLFLRAVEDGRVPKGSYLLVENIDRLTRSNMFDAQTLFMNILRAGITVVTLTNNQTYSRESINTDPTQTLFLVVELMRANQESARKGQLVSDAKERKRQRLMSGETLAKPYTKQTPAWIAWNAEDKSYQLIPERADVVRFVFQQSDAGWGLDRVARALNMRGEPTWGAVGSKRKGDHWRGSYLRKIVASKAPIGMFTPHKTTHERDTGRRKDIPLDAVALWPAVVDEELYWRVSRRTQARAPRGKNADRAPTNAFAGVLRCARCGGTVIRVSKGVAHGRGRENVYLVCARAHNRAHGCEYLAVRYRDVEDAFKSNVEHVIRTAPRGKNTAAIDRRINNLLVGVELLESETRDAAEFAAQEKTPAARELFRAKEAELERTRATLRDLRGQRNTLTTASVRSRLKEVYEAFSAEPLSPATANAAVKQAIKTITLDAREATLALLWHHSEESQVISFVSPHKDWTPTLPEATG